MTETAHDAYQRQVVELATMLGFKHLHVRPAIGKGRQWVTATNREGWPDLLFWHPHRGGFAAIEIKIKPDKPKPNQVEVLRELAAAGIPTMVAYPSDIDAVQAFLIAARGHASCDPIGLPPEAATQESG